MLNSVSRVVSRLVQRRFVLTSVRSFCSTTNPTTTRGQPEFGARREHATFRYPLPWTDPDFYNRGKLEQEMRRVFDVCHGCRLCYSLCDSFPTLFDLIDNSKTGELDSVPSTAFKKVVDKCTLCDMCFLSKCPYVPPHPLNIDVPHLMLRYKATENMHQNTRGITLQKPLKHTVESVTGSKMEGASTSKDTPITLPETSRQLILKRQSFVHSLYTNTDQMGNFATAFSSLVRWVTKTAPVGSRPRLIRRLLEWLAGIHQRAELPQYVPRRETFMNKSKSLQIPLNPKGKAYGKKVVLFATCLVNYNKPQIGHASRAVLAHQGIDVKIVYPQCCGMPLLEQGRVREVAERASRISSVLKRYIDEGYDIVTPVASCSLMLKKEWPLLLPDNVSVAAMAAKTYDVSEYVVRLAKDEKLDLESLRPLRGIVTLHHACHARAQSMGFKSEEMLKLIPNLRVASIERCSGHGGSFGVQKDGYETALKVGRPVFQNAIRNHNERGNADEPHYLASDCPLAVEHIKQGMHEIDKTLTVEHLHTKHPIELLAESYNLNYPDGHQKPNTP
jgi:glycerol-3-phosphate dehydrogenase subunit C